jgi:hypothetical protein
MQNTPTAYKPLLKELKLPACAARVLPALPNDAAWLLMTLVHHMPGVVSQGARVANVKRWLAETATLDDQTTTSGEPWPLQVWARSHGAGLDAAIDAAIDALVREGLVAIGRTKPSADAPRGETKVVPLPIEEWADDRHFLAGLALRWQ